MKQKLKIKLNHATIKELRNKIILVTGGSGSIGSKITKRLLEYPVKQVRVLDINEHSLFTLNRSINDSRLRLLLGSILDKERVEMACKDVDIVIHTAAVKNLDITEFNPIETIDTNINGTVNLIKTIIRTKPKKFINISTDKAAEPSTLYGVTKQLSEHLTSWAGGHITTTKFATIRFGNVFETRGNVFEIWKEQNDNNHDLTITDPKMKRYFIHVDDSVEFILSILSLMKVGEIFVPKMKLYNMKNLASQVSKKHKIIGIRPGEKLEEILITRDEIKKAENRKDMWIIRPYSK
ncbi:MAG: SDR family NAD(P)-dependent oxidoreductase [Nitrosarchaeum sp.]|nr:SDR family NAD(P)-dependent oxidoreductase [Nitrosarchaeum sp.]